MPRRALPSSTLIAAVRKHFGLEQTEIADFLGISRGLVAHIEAGRRALTGGLLVLLTPLAERLPAGPTPEVSAQPVPPAPARSPLEARLDYCRHHVARLRRALREPERRALFAGRWQAALPALLAAETDPERRAWLSRRATPLTPDEAAAWHLLRLRAEALETEAAALAALLVDAI